MGSCIAIANSISKLVIYCAESCQIEIRAYRQLPEIGLYEIRRQVNLDRGSTVVCLCQLRRQGLYDFMINLRDFRCHNLESRIWYIKGILIWRGGPPRLEFLASGVNVTSNLYTETHVLDIIRRIFGFGLGLSPEALKNCTLSTLQFILVTLNPDGRFNRECAVYHGVDDHCFSRFPGVNPGRHWHGVNLCESSFETIGNEDFN